ncbi:MAG: UvrD-helicase domain-containing protein [Sphingobacteriaceae bacterium]
MNDAISKSNKPLKILQASAGSGKTYSLTAHYLTLLFASPNKYREILAVTFTNKATEEMKSRILSVLKGLAVGESEMSSFREIILQAHPQLTVGQLKIDAHAIYRRILHDYSRFAINTIDGFVQRVIRGFAFELGLDAGYKLEMNTEKVKQELADKLNAQLDQNPELLQWIINLALDRIRDNKSWNYRDTLLELAGEIFKERYQPFENALKNLDATTLFGDLQLVTRQMLEYVESYLNETAENGNTILNHSGNTKDELKGKSRSPVNNLSKIAAGDFSKISSLQKLIDNPEEWQKGALSVAVSTLYNQLNPVLKRLVSFYNEECSKYEMAKAINANLAYLRIMQEMAGLLKVYRTENQLLLISDAQALLKGITQDQQDNPSFIWEKMGSRYRHFLFDEFQDTSSLQWDNFLPLLKNTIAEANGTLIDNLIVGDVKQSIYRWRNGDWRILLHQAGSDIGAQNVVDDSLAENYRSASNIIDFNNFLFQTAPPLLQQMINDKVLEEGGDAFFENWWKENGFDQIMTRAYEQSFQQKAGTTPKGGNVEISFLPVSNNRSRASDCKEEALDKLSKTVHQWLSAEVPVYEPGQVCILVRTNTQAAEVIEYLMKDQQRRSAEAKENISLPAYKPYQILSGEALLVANNSAVKLILHTLHWMVSKHDQAAVYKSVCVQLYCNLQKKVISPDVWMKIPTASANDLKGLLPDSLCENWFEWQQLPLFVLIEHLIGAYQLDQKADSLSYLFAFRDMVSKFAQQGDKGISRFLLWWKDEGQKKALPSSGKSNAVQIMTIHKSKGLAFDVVMLPFCNWNLDGKPNNIFWVPTAETPYAMLQSVPVNYKKSLGQSAFAKAYFEELLFNYMDALNMLYVATTRTRAHLYVTAPAFAEGKTEKLSMAGDLIYGALTSVAIDPENKLRHFEEDFDGATLMMEEPIPNKYQVEKPKQAGAERFMEQDWRFETYPLSNRLNDAVTNQKVWEQLDLLSGNNAQRTGVILHDLLAQTTTVEALPSILHKMQQSGLFREAEKAKILELATSVLQQPQLSVLLNKPYKSFNEQTIINRLGESYRPDKVLVGEKEVVIIDFKFTGEPKPAHQQQLAEYRILLQEMGYSNINAWLYYGYLKQLVSLTLEWKD